ncbi:hypothetical protein D5S17_10535 [Pseudonocardiaceae bacterium YIM PH 21723]|nr:hypothetical protein D5S17_10535 [Pseudonocardiaceae bacterium YIM PH 21723]
MSKPQPYELPEFYLPHPARLNPHLEATRVHTKAWAYEMDMIDTPAFEGGPPVMSERAFDTFDYGGLVAWTHPDASKEELDLLADWYVWVFWFDDHFLDTFKHTGDMAGAKEYLARLHRFMPVDGVDSGLEITNATEKGLADLWVRTVPAMSGEWRKRFIANTIDLFDESLWELANRESGRLANPITYVLQRRKVGGAPWSANLVEHAIEAEWPLKVAHTRPLQVLSDTFSDGVHMLNDLFSYQREIETEGEINNAVHVMSEYFGLPLQKAADLVNDIRTSRLKQFENTVFTELPALFAEYALTPQEQAKIALYASALQDWQVGGHEWHMNASRYMNQKRGATPPITTTGSGIGGLGTAAANIRKIFGLEAVA